ncbi:MAG: 2-phospho-L-lactate guanylyltransferase [Candidatus Hydrothermarchaeales archaeon]
MIYAIVPVNKLSKAKTRLSSTLSRSERGEFLLCMLEDVLRALDGVCKTIVICADDLREHLSEDVIFLDEDGRKGLNGAVKMANRYAIERGARATLFVPADLPLIKGSHVKEILKIGEKHPLIISPSRYGGTGILYRRPPDIIKERFTKTSFADYKKEAKAEGVELFVYDSYLLSLDIDRIEDIEEFMLHGEGTSTYDFLRDLSQ